MKRARTWKTAAAMAHVLAIVALSGWLVACSGGDGTTEPEADTAADAAADVGGGPDVQPDDTGAPDVQEDLGKQDVPASTPPEIEWLEPAFDGCVGPDTPIRIRVSHESGIEWVVFGVNPDALEQRIGTEDSDVYEFTLADYDLDPFPEGPQVLVAVARAKDGTESSPSGHRVFVDAVAPTVELLGEPELAEGGTRAVIGTATLRFRAVDDIGVASIQVFVDDELVRDLPATPTGEFVVSFDLSEKAASRRITVKALDCAGNEGEAVREIEVIPRPPYRLGHTFDFGEDIKNEALRISDYDDDGYPDAWIATADGLWLLLGTDGGEFRGGFKMLGAPEGRASRILLGDFDDDGLEDLLLLRLEGSGMQITVAIREPASDPNLLDTFLVYDAGLIEGAKDVVALSDVTEDGIPDLIVGLNLEEESVAVLVGLAVPDLPLDETPTAPADGEGPVDTSGGDSADAMAPPAVEFFAEPRFLRGVAGITDIRVVDANGDNHFDLIVGRENARQISCYLGLGNGEFLDAYDSYVADDPAVVFPGDFLGNDGIVDLVVSAREKGRVALLKGDNTGFFQVEPDNEFNAGVPIAEIVGVNLFSSAGSKPDLVGLMPGASTIYVVRYRGAPGNILDTAGAFSTGTAPKDLHVRDMNRDGRLDIVFRNAQTGRVTTFLGLGSGDFDGPPLILLQERAEDDGQPLEPLVIGAGRVNSEDVYQTDDLVVVTERIQKSGYLRPPDEPGGEWTAMETVSQTPILVYESNGELPVGGPIGGPKWSYIDPIFSGTPVGLVLGTFDLGGDVDIAIAYDSSPSNTRTVGPADLREDVNVPNVAVLRGRGDGKFEPYQPPGDVWMKTWLETLGFSTLGVAQNGVYGESFEQYPSSMTSLLLDLNNRPDLLIVSDARGEPGTEEYQPPLLTTWHCAAGSTRASFDGPFYAGQVGGGPAWPTPADVDNNGRFDMVVSNRTTQNISVLTAAGGSAPVGSFDIPRDIAAGAEPKGIATADMDGDRYEDFVVALRSNLIVGYGLAPVPPANWAFETVQFVFPGRSYPRQTPTGVVLEDMNQDGRPDILVTNAGSDTLTIVFGSGGRRFPGYMDVPTGAGPSTIIQADFNGDDPVACPDFAILNERGRSITLLVSRADCR